jgi:hypothetical protein
MERVAFAALTIACGLALDAAAQNAPVTVSIDANASRHAINPMIYGVNFGSPTDLKKLNAPLNRQGGDNMSRYNWNLNARNLDFDYYFESYPFPSSTPGEAADTFIAQSKVQHAIPMITIPMIGWVAKLGANRGILSSFSVAKYGAQCHVDPYDTDAGDGIHTDCSTDVTGNDPNDANVPENVTTEKAWVQHLIKRWGLSSAGGLTYYLTDNESSIWYSTHRDVHPVGPHATEIRDDVIAYSAMIKGLDPGAKVVGPEEWGWEGYFYSGYDQQYAVAHGYCCFPDKQNVMGGQDYLPWLLQQWKASGHPIDVLSVHFYPQGNEDSNDVSTATQLLRNRSTRQLWDPNYVSESWINAKVDLIPKLKSWVKSYYYSGTPVAITEYNWGAENHINGATTQADILGIFGRTGLNMATRWTVPAAATPTYKAMMLYRNYDGLGSAFGDVSVKTVGPNPDQLSAFAAQRTGDGALTVIVINKVLTGSTPVTVTLANFTARGTAAVYQLTSANLIKHLAGVAWAGGKFAATVPPQSITLFELPK